MRKPDIFDEIIQCLKTDAQTGADTSMNEETLRDLYARPVRRPATQPQVPVQATARVQAAAQVQTTAPGAPPRPRQQAAPAQSIQGIPPAYAPDMPDWESLRTECAACMKCRLGPTRTNMVFADGNPHAELMFIGEGPRLGRRRNRRAVRGTRGRTAFSHDRRHDVRPEDRNVHRKHREMPPAGEP